MQNKAISVDISLKADYFDVDSMKVVWHGNYIKFYEQARCALLDSIGYNYNEMEYFGHVWPIVKLEVKYIKSIYFAQEFNVKATLAEYENRIRIEYIVYDKLSGDIINKGETVQMAVDIKTGTTLFVSPQELIKCVEAYHQKSEVLV